MERYDIAIIGAGPVGLMTALQASKTQRVLLLAPDEPDRKETRRIESIPLPLLGLLVEHGVHPNAIGATHAFYQSTIAWGTSRPVIVHMRKTAHLNRPDLERALWDTIMCEGRITTRIGDEKLTLAGDMTVRGADWLADRIIDATGRVALTAQHIVKPPQPWAARNFIVDAHAITDKTFQLAALPDGYVYRLGTSTTQTVVFVGRDSAVKGTPDDLENSLVAAQAEWIMAGLPRLAEFGVSETCVSSLQWATSGCSILVGEAALARDILSSQGLACGLSEAMYASALSDARSCALFAQRQMEQRYLHRQSLGRQLNTNRYCRHPTWMKYRQFVEVQKNDPRPPSRIALRANQISVETSWTNASILNTRSGAGDAIASTTVY